MNCQKIIANSIKQGRLAHAVLLHGAVTSSSQALLSTIVQMLLCQETGRIPCNYCCSCKAIAIGSHPDLKVIKPEKLTCPIKIAQIRELNDIVYLSPKIGLRRVIQISRIEQMNLASSNALLRILEEPPQSAYFILYATNISNILPTIISRCQIWHIPESPSVIDEFAQFIQLPATTKWTDIFLDLSAILARKETVCEIAERWLQYDLYNLVGVLYWFYAWLITYCLGNRNYPHEMLPILAPQLSKSLTVPKLFKQIDKMNAIMEQLNNSISLNPLLTLEAILLEWYL